MKLQITTNDKFGTQRFYPMNETALNFCKLLEQKTLTAEDLVCIKALGFEIEEIPWPTLRVESND
jgi:hypothetical protein